MAAAPPQHTVIRGNQLEGHSIGISGDIVGDINGDINHNVYMPEDTDAYLRALRVTDPREDKLRIERGKGKLQKDCYSWILENPDFRNWRESKGSKLLWIKGDPGKGKTMMMIALIEELERNSERKFLKKFLKTGQCIVSYFFCQSTDSRLNSAVSVLKGLIYLLITQNKRLVKHVRKKYHEVGNQIFEGPNVIYTLQTILRDILSDSMLGRIYLLMDALDECSDGLRQLLDIITDDTLETQYKIKWLVSSRNRPDIEERLRSDNARIMVHLELNATHVSQAVRTFIDFKVQDLTTRKNYDGTLQEIVKGQLSRKSEATFLWVSLACKQLEEEPIWKTESVLQGLPSGLDPLYGRMIDQILTQSSDTVEYCKRILRTATIAYRPLSVNELVATTELPHEISSSIQYLSDLVHRCGSILTIREGTLYFIHQSAKDYLISCNDQKIICSNQAEEHGKIMRRSLEILSKALKKDICGLKKPGILIKEIGDFYNSSLP